MQKLKKQRLDYGRLEFRRNKIRFSTNDPSNTITFIAPTIFSMQHNAVQTIEFYKKILEQRDKNIFGSTFFIDSSNVINVTADAIMFLIAVITAIKYNKSHNYHFKGNFPKNVQAKTTYADCGFLNYVQMNSAKFNKNTKQIRIIQGNNVDPNRAKQACDFASKYCKMTQKDTARLYPVIVELMSNTTQHAYKSEDSFNIPHNWYFFAEKQQKYVQYVFLDTGDGIPTTVYKTMHERLMINLLRLNKDSELIRSTLDGTFRSETENKHRGEGLPQISECFKSGLFHDVSVFSRKGSCMLNSDISQDYIEQNFSDPIIGTLFCWKIKRER